MLMKIRSGMVSNSSSSSFVISLKDFSPEDQGKIAQLTERNADLGRCTGRITDVDFYLKMLQYEDCETGYEPLIRELMEEHGDIIIVRESDEDMGGCFEDYGISLGDIVTKAKIRYEWH
jgi:hypothetical protein